MKQLIANLLKKQINLKENENLIEIPPTPDLGDYAFPCFTLSKQFKKNPNEIAKDLKKKIQLPKEIEKIEINGAYLNFFVNKQIFAENLIKEILKEKEKFGSSDIGKGKKVMVEFPSPNTNKPLHLGHLRNMSLGESVSRILEFSGSKIIRANLNNDRGIHICKSMLAYEKFGKNKKPNKKSDHFVGDYYVLYNKKSKEDKQLEKEIQEMLLMWEKGDKKTLELWKKMNKWALDGFEETYKKFGIKHDKNYYESEIYTKGRDIINDGIKKKIFHTKQDGATAINLEKEKLGEKIVLRADGTSLYITQDIYLAKLKNKEYNLDQSIYVVGNEQDYHFNVLAEILKKLKFPYSVHHLSYGMVNLPDGKMKSREGTIIDADNLIEEVQSLVKKSLQSREKLSVAELEKRSLKITLSAIKYLLLKIDIKKNTIFNPKESISFEGDTGPYLLYSYARASSILRKVKKSRIKSKTKNLNDDEFKLVKKISQFPEVIENAYRTFNPALVANYSYELAKTFNEFYHACPVINSENESFRLKLVDAFKIILKNSLNLLGIETIERM